MTYYYPPRLKVPIQVYNGQDVDTVHFKIEWTDAASGGLNLTPRPSDTKDRLWLGWTHSGTVSGDSWTITSSGAAPIGLGRTDVVWLCFTMDAPAAWDDPAYASSFSLWETWAHETGEGEGEGCDTLTQSDCMNYTPVSPYRDMKYAVRDAALYAIIGKDDEVAIVNDGSGAFGWPDDTAEITVLDAHKVSGVASIEDISGLAEMTALQTLDLSGNYGLPNLTGLEGLANLTNVNLTGCTGLLNLDALVENANFASGDSLNVTGCSLIPGVTEDLDTLCGRGVSVTGYTCP